jgi:DNA-binding NtrC family response regulator
MVDEGTFSKELYDQISTLRIHLPPLSLRREDLPLLQSYFIERLAAQYKKPVRGIARDAQMMLARHSWSGNVDELENVLAEAVMRAQGDTIQFGDLPMTLQRYRIVDSADSNRGVSSLEEIQNSHVETVLALVNGNRAEAAEILGISRTTMYRRFAKNKAS